jgi:hypothetical protein
VAVLAVAHVDGMMVLPMTIAEGLVVVVAQGLLTVQDALLALVVVIEHSEATHGRHIHAPDHHMVLLAVAKVHGLAMLLLHRMMLLLLELLLLMLLMLLQQHDVGPAVSSVER